MEKKIMISIKSPTIVHTNSNRLSVVLNRIKIKYLVSVCCLFTCTGLYSQIDVLYSQYMNNMLNINPAYAGSRAGDNVTALYRKQWLNIEGAPTSFSLSWDRGTEDIGDGLHQKFQPVSYGLQLYSDRLGVESSQGFQSFYSYRIKFPTSYFAFGVSAGVMSYKALYSQVSTIDGGDPSFQEDVNSFLPTVGIGTMYATLNWYVGLSAPALLKTRIRDNRYKLTTAEGRFFLTGGYIFDVSDYLKLKPSILIKEIKGEPFSFDFNMNAWVMNSVGFGVSYRVNDAVVGMFQLQVTPQITVGYAYDYITSSLKTFSTGSHELLLRFEFNRPKYQHILSPRYY
jgi:type IX secretion system PorP/SprF family membrane protein